MKQSKSEEFVFLPSRQLISVEEKVLFIIKKLKERGNQALFIGGSVRDAVLGIEPKDIDIEVYKISYNDLKDFLSAYGKVDLVGKSFGVIRFRPKLGEDLYGDQYEFSIPRRENKIGIGHKSFEVIVDPGMTIKDAGVRRDFTINSISYDIIENKIYDYFGGLEDLKNGIIKHTSDQFGEDPLRILRAMQFQARFGFNIHSDTLKVCRQLLQVKHEFDSLPKERLFVEFCKWAEKGERHDLIFSFMRDTGLIEYYPELKLLKETPQDKIWHPEGDVEIHTTMCLADMDKIIAREKITGTEKLILVLSILLHDIAKPPTTKEEMKKGRMAITSNGHEAMGGEMCKDILSRLGFHEELIIPISNLIANHLAGVSISSIKARSGKMRAVKRLSRRLAPATIHQLLYVMEADQNGRGKKKWWEKLLNMVGVEFRKVGPGSKEISELAKELKIQKEPYQYLLMGRHLIEAGLKPSPKFREILGKASEAQESGVFSDLDGAKHWLINHLQEIETTK